MKLSAIYANGLLKSCKIIDVNICGSIMDSTNLTLNEIDRMLSQAMLDIQKLCSCTVCSKMIVGCAFRNSLAGLAAFLLCVKNDWVYVPLDRTVCFNALQSTLLKLNATFLFRENFFEISKTAMRYVGSVFEGKIHIYQISHVIKLNCDSDWLDNLAYIISTSGTTGLRKHVLVSHEAILSNVNSIIRKMGLVEDEVIAQNTSYLFDPCFIEILSWLVIGCTLLIYPDEFQLNAEKFNQLVVGFGATFLQTTPSSLSLWGAGKVGKCLLSDGTPLRHLALGGERFAYSLLSGKSPGNQTRIYNLYGLTEMSCWATMADVTLLENDLVESPAPTVHGSNQLQHFSGPGACIGQPMDETELDFQPCSSSDKQFSLTLRSSKRLCAILLNDMSLREFYQANESLFPSETVVETRDLFENVNGEWHFAGRMDNEIKLLGRRFNLDHLKELVVNYKDPQLEWAPFANAAAMLYNNRIHCFLQPNDSRLLKGDAERASMEKNLRLHLLRQIPEIFVPQNWVLMPSLPCNVNGKVDNKLLLDFLKCQNTAKDSSSTKGVTDEKSEAMQQKFLSLLVEALPSTASEGDNSIDMSRGFLSNEGTSLKAYYVVCQLFSKSKRSEVVENVLLGFLLADVSLGFIQASLVSIIASEADSPEQMHKSLKSEVQENPLGSESLPCPRETWTVDMELCVDAGCVSDSKEQTVFIDSVAYCCSYDSCIYALDFRAKIPLWTCKLSSAITSSPAVSYDQEIPEKESADKNAYSRFVFCGDLSGCLVKVASSTGHVLETRSLNKPVFADLLLLKNESCLLVCQVDGTILLLSTSNLDLKWKLNVENKVANLFSRPLLMEKRDFIFISDSCGSVHILNLNGILVRTVDSESCSKLGNPVLLERATIWDGKTEIKTESKTFPALRSQTSVIFASSDGTFFILEESDEFEHKNVLLNLNIDVFAPISLFCKSSFLLFGSRNDKLHCFKLD
ncbi:beta-alanine-activating enzyme-like isoform X2 [Convolutriloba macropyga]|uniref:beta-alanine-activating enzyme-like isoform X2 n=1 Tax=Convolutriloba macropyga TaxID=536237 RepID=UPI003F51DC22